MRLPNYDADYHRIAITYAGQHAFGGGCCFGLRVYWRRPAIVLREHCSRFKITHGHVPDKQARDKVVE